MPAANVAPPPLDAGTIAALLPEDVRRRFNVHTIDSTGSTNSDLLRDALTRPSGTVLAAEHQTAGRGRRGRIWLAPAGGSLAFSVLWKFKASAAALSGLSLAIGLAVARAAEGCGATHIALKWPNDLLLFEKGAWKKVGGILVELALEPAGHSASSGIAAAVIGIGLNVDLRSADHPIGQPVSDLRHAGCMADRNQVLAAILHQLGRLLPAFEESGFAPLAEEWVSRHAWQGEAVTLLADGAPTIAGLAQGVDADGALVLQTANGMERIVSGDVSLRRVTTDPVSRS